MFSEEMVTNLEKT